jgi:hypothetical protein
VAERRISGANTGKLSSTKQAKSGIIPLFLTPSVEGSEAVEWMDGRGAMLTRFRCVARTNRGFMPGEVVGFDEEGFIQVEAPNHRIYSFPDDAIFTPEEGSRLMQGRRIQKVVHEYEFEELNDTPQVVRCFNPEHPRRSNYVLARGRDGWTCTCEAFSRFRWRQCKHIAAWLEVQRLTTPPDSEPQAAAAAPPLLRQAA